MTLDGQPLAQGSILFVPGEGTSGTATGGDIKDGKYRLFGAKGPAVGWNRVEITAARPSGKMVPDPLGPPGSRREMYVSAVATRFNTDSTLKIEIQPGENRADFDVAGE